MTILGLSMRICVMITTLPCNHRGMFQSFVQLWNLYEKLAYKCSNNIFHKAKISMATWFHKCLQKKVINSSSSESELQQWRPLVQNWSVHQSEWKKLNASASVNYLQCKQTKLSVLGTFSFVLSRMSDIFNDWPQTSNLVAFKSVEKTNSRL